MDDLRDDSHPGLEPFDSDSSFALIIALDLELGEAERLSAECLAQGMAVDRHSPSEFTAHGHVNSVFYAWLDSEQRRRRECGRIFIKIVPITQA